MDRQTEGREGDICRNHTVRGMLYPLVYLKGEGDALPFHLPSCSTDVGITTALINVIRPMLAHIYLLG